MTTRHKVPKIKPTERPRWMMAIFKLRCLSAVITAICITPTIFCQVTEDTPAKARELIPLPLLASQRQALSIDSPMQDFFVTEDDRIYILGQKAIWDFDPRTAKLAKISTPDQNINDEIVWLPTNEGLYLGTNRELLRYQHKSKTLISYSLPPRSGSEPITADSKPESSIAIIQDGNNIFWVKQSAIWQLDKEGSTLDFYSDNLFLKSGDRIHINHKSQEISLIRGRYLLHLETFHQDSTLTVLQKTPSPMFDAYFIDNQIAALTQEALLVFDTSGQLEQAVSVNHNRLLFAGQVKPSGDIYLFNDGTIEGYQRESKESWYAHLDFLPQQASGSENSKIYKIMLGLRVIGVLDQGNLQLYSLSDPNSSISSTSSPSTETLGTL